MSHPLQSKLTVSLLTNDPVVMIDNLPPGWATKFFKIIHGLKDIIQVNLTGLDIKDGVLYISYLSMSDTPHELAQYVTRSVLQQSAQTCMICGKYARRRKEQAHKPALCREHYLEYINSLEE